MSAFGVPTERLSAIADRHIDVLKESEQIALLPLAMDNDVHPDEFVAFVRYRAIVSLRTTFLNDLPSFRAFLAAVDVTQVRAGL